MVFKKMFVQITRLPEFIRGYFLQIYNNVSSYMHYVRLTGVTHNIIPFALN